MKLYCILVALALAVPALAESRTWSTADGESSLEAEYMAATEDGVKIRRVADRRVFEIKLERLSEEDRKWVAAKLAAEEEAAARSDEAGPYAKLLTGEWERAEGHGISYRIFGGRKLRGEHEEGYPLVIFLHGRGGDVMTPAEPWEARFFAQDANYRERPCVIIAPQVEGDGGWGGDCGESVVDLIEDLTKNLSIDKDRIYLTGYSMGAWGTFGLLVEQPKLFAAAVPVSGGGNTSRAEDFKKVAVWLFHGALDKDVDPENSRRMYQALQDVKATVKYTEYPDDGHGIAQKAFADPKMHEWLFEQRR